MNTCTNCGYQVPPDKSICPNCGQPIAKTEAWPPEPMNAFTSTTPDPKTFITGKRWGDLWLGFLLNWGLLVVYGLGIFITPILYFVFRQERPTFARGLGFGMLSVGVVLLGGFAICMGALVLSEGGRRP